jgi:hypothetical protein
MVGVYVCPVVVRWGYSEYQLTRYQLQPYSRNCRSTVHSRIHYIKFIDFPKHKIRKCKKVKLPLCLVK